MGQSMIVALGSAGLVALVLAATLVNWSRSRSARVLVQGLGVALAIIGLYIVRFMDLVYDWVRAAIHWVVTTPFDTTRLVGAIVGGVGVLMFVIGMAISPVSRAEAKQRRLARQQKAQQVEAARPSAPASTKPASTKPASTSAGPAKKSASDDDDAEIEAILRNRGIN